MSIIVKNCPSFVACCGCNSVNTETAKCVTNKNCPMKKLILILNTAKKVTTTSALEIAMNDALNLLGVEEE